ncbi:MAG TPA: PAS domain S-box protein [Lunatimonas sp.]|nr:PAS domain S-box protein [Lunatimonas sp.]
MIRQQLTDLLIDNSKDLIWVVDSEFKLVYANASYLNLIRKITGKENGLNESIFVEGFGEDVIEKWKSYYYRALKGEHFETEENFYNPDTQDIAYGQTTFFPIVEDTNQVLTVVCQSKDITEILRRKSSANHLMDASLDTFCTINEAGNFEFVSAAAVTHWGYLPEELIGRPVVELILEEDKSKTNEIGSEIIGGQHVKSFVNRYRKKDGTIAYNLWSARWDNDSKLMFCVARDAKEQIQKEELISQSEHRFKALVQDGSDLIAILDCDGNYIYVSPTSIQVLGFAPDEFIGRNAFEFIHPDDVERTAGSLQRIGTQNKVMIEPFRFQNNKKEWRWVETILTNMLDNPAVKGIVANSRDITDKIEEEQKLKLLEKVINSTTDAIVITEASPLDEPGPVISYVNKAFTKMTGYTAEEALGQNPRFLQGSASNKEDLKKLGEKLRRWENAETTVLNYTKTGDEFYVNFAVSPVDDQNGNITHLISIQRDVTEQKYNELKKDLLSQISLIFSEEEELLPAAKGLCEKLYAFGKFDLIELWCPNVELSQIKLFAHHPYDELLETSDDSITSFALGVGLPGKVWQNRKQLVWDEAQIKQHFIRINKAGQQDLKSILGIPLTFKNEVVGVLVIGSKRDVTSLGKFSKIILHLEKFIGSEINRKRLENDLKHLYDAIPDILCLTDFDARFLRINKAGCELLGYTQEEILFHPSSQFVHPSDRDIFFDELRRNGWKATSFKYENRYITKEGNIIWLSWSCNSSIVDGLIYASAKNITEEIKLRELNVQAGTMAKIGAWEVDLEKSEAFWSEMVHQLHETDSSSFIPTLEKSIDFYRGDFRNMVKERVKDSVEIGSGFDFEAVIVTQTLKEKWVRVIGTVERVNGVSKRIFGSFQDISDRKEQEIRLQSFANNLPGVAYQYFIYPDGRDELKYVTPGAKQIWGFSAEQVMNDIGLVWNQIQLGGEIENVKRSIAKSIQNRTNWSAQWQYIMPNKELRMHAGYGSPNFLPDGAILFHSLILDITEESRNKELLDQASNMAKIGSWELNLTSQEESNVYWSPMTREILGIDEKFQPSVSAGFEFYAEESKSAIRVAIDELISNAKEFDLELLITTQKGKEKWVRCIGKSEQVNGKCTKIYGSFQDIHVAKSLEIKVREILESISDAFYAVDADWRFTYFNKEAERLLNRNESGLIGMTIWEEFPAILGTEIETAYRQVVNTNRPQSLEYFFPETNCWYEVNAYPSNKGVSVYFKNVNERKQASELLTKAFKEKNEILESIGDAFFAVNKDWTVTYWNKQAENILGRKREAMVGKNLWEEYADAIDSDFYRQYHIALSTGEIISFEEYYVTLDIWVEVTVYPSESGLSIYFKDITLRKKADIRLLQANERFKLATKATNDLIWDWDIENNAFFRTKNINKFFGRNSVLKMKENQFWEDKFHPDDLEQIKKSMQNSLNDPKSQRWEMEYRIFNENQEELSVIDRGIIVRNDTGRAVRMVGAMTDLTRQKKMENELFQLNESLKKYARELERSNEELEQFAFVTSHDLQEPLRMISSFMDQLKRKYGNQLDEKAHEYIHFASDGAKRMKQIILDLLLYSQANKQLEEIEEVDLNEILLDFSQLRRRLIEEKSASIISEALPQIKTYRAPITQIFNCLLENAIKYSKMDVAPNIEIMSAEKENEWEFAVRDNGIGVEEIYFEKIFVIFQRLHGREYFSGNGIGLSVAKRSVEFLGGRIWLTSSLGRGTTFYFTIPKHR